MFALPCDCPIAAHLALHDTHLHADTQYTYGTNEAVESNLAYDNEKGIMAVRAPLPRPIRAHPLTRITSHARTPRTQALFPTGDILCLSAAFATL